MEWLRRNNEHYKDITIDFHCDVGNAIRIDNGEGVTEESDDEKADMEYLKKLREHAGERLLTQAIKNIEEYAAVEIDMSKPKGSTLELYKMQSMTGWWII